MVERSAGIVVFYKGRGGRDYLILRHAPSDYSRLGQTGNGREYWNFPKGHIEKGEKSEETALREVAEETGLKNVVIVPGFRQTERYVYALAGQKIYKWVVWFLGEAKTKNITLSFEHSAAKWLPYEEALKKVTYSSSKKLLIKAHAFFSGKHKQ